MKRRVRLGALLLVAAALALPGCDQAAEQAAEKAIEQGTGADVDIEDDSVKVTDEQGNQFAAGDDVELPDSWPAAVPAPSGKLVFAAASASEGASGVWEVEAGLDEAVADYAGTLNGAGFAVGESVDLGAGQTRTFEGNGLRVTVIAAESQTGGSGTALTVSVLPAD